MGSNETYDFIGNLAVALYSQDIQISLTSLRSILDDRDMTYGNERGMGAGVSAAYTYWKENKEDPVVHHAIAHTYVDQEGELAWKKN